MRSVALLCVLVAGTGAQGAWPALPYNQSGQSCGQLTYHPQANAAASQCEQACCSAPNCDVWQWKARAKGAHGGCWMAPFRVGPDRGCPPNQGAGPWVGGSKIPHPHPSPVSVALTSTWAPHWQHRGSYDATMCESTPFWWPKDKKMYLMECVCRGPDDWAQKGPWKGHWGHAEQWLPEYRNHSYIRIRDMESGNVVQNISLSIGFGFGAAFVDYDHGQLWISATANGRSSPTAPRPYGPPHDHSCSETHWECNGVWVFNSSDLTTWTRRQTDVKWNGPNTDIARVYPSPAHPTPTNLPPHRYVMVTEKGAAWAVNDNADGDLSHSWVTLPASKAYGGIEACPSVRYLPSDGYYSALHGVRWQQNSAHAIQGPPCVEGGSGPCDAVHTSEPGRCQDGRLGDGLGGEQPGERARKPVVPVPVAVGSRFQRRGPLLRELGRREPGEGRAGDLVCAVGGGWPRDLGL